MKEQTGILTTSIHGDLLNKAMVFQRINVTQEAMDVTIADYVGTPEGVVDIDVGQKRT